jgi:hypothetical protein
VLEDDHHRASSARFKTRTGKGAIIIVFLDQAPSFVRLAFDIGFTGLALGLEGN